MKKIDIEAHFFTKEYEEAMLRRKEFPCHQGHRGHSVSQ